MKAQTVQSKTTTLGPFLTLILSSQEAKCEDEGSREASGDRRTGFGAVIGSAGDVAEAQSDQPVMVKLGPMLSLLTMLRRRSPRRDRSRWQGPTLPRGCVMVVRYSSR